MTNGAGEHASRTHRDKWTTGHYLAANGRGSVAAAQKSCQDLIKQTIVFIVDSFYCFSFYCIDLIGLDLLRATTWWRGSDCKLIPNQY